MKSWQEKQVLVLNESERGVVGRRVRKDQGLGDDSDVRVIESCLECRKLWLVLDPLGFPT